MSGFDSSANTLIGSGPELVRPVSIAFNSDTNQLLIADPGSTAVFIVDPASGDRRLLSGNGPGFVALAGASFFGNQQAIEMIVDAGLGVLFAVDLETGSRNILSGENPDTGEVTGSRFDLFSASAVVLDETGNRALVTGDLDGAGPVVVDLSTGETCNLSLSATGPNFTTSTDVILDDENNRLLVIDVYSQAVFAIDLITEERVIISWTDLRGFL